MKYMGSKLRISKYILPIILRDRSPDQWYIEPFCGGCNTLDKVFGNVLGADNNYYLIAMCKAATKGWLPPKEFTENQYIMLKNNKDKYPAELVGYAGFALSYGGKWFGGWRRDSSKKRNYVLEAYKNAIKQFPLLSGKKFEHSEFDKLSIPPKSIIYCDPPYQNTTKYHTEFDHNNFWRWCKDKAREGHTVFVSEYDAPDGVICLWEKEQTSSLTKNTGNKRATEKLFKIIP